MSTAEEDVGGIFAATSGNDYISIRFLVCDFQSILACNSQIRKSNCPRNKIL